MEDLRDQFQELALPCMGPLYRTALRLTRRAEDASDLVQEACLRAFRTFSNFTPGTNGKAWLFKILYSIFINDYHRKQREPESYPLEEVERKFEEALAAKDSDVLEHLLRSTEMGWKGGEVEAALNQLPEDFRAVVLLVDVEELSYEEAAAVFQCPVGTVRSRLARARKMLFLCLREYAEARGYLKLS